jgi:hypothetical protein
VSHSLRCSVRARLIASVVAGAIATLFVVPARAANPSKGPLAGVLQVTCTVRLASFPSGPGKRANSWPCLGATNGALTGLVQTAPGGVVAAAAASAATSVTLNYEQPCVAGALGFSNGVATAFNVFVTGVLKSIQTDGLPVLGTLTIPYSWTRVGVTAVVTTGKLTPVTDPLKPQTNTRLSWAGKTARDLVGGVGLGVLVPLGIPDVSNCPGPPLDVAASAVIAMM